MKTCYFVRHGEAQANADGLLAGAKTDSPLTARGEKQAHELVRTLAGKEIDLIVTSPLLRASRTAELIAADLGYRGVIEPSSLFIERDFGSATNMPKAEAFASLDNGTATDVESILDFGERARQVLTWLRNRSEEHILIVSHAAFGQMLGTVQQGGRPEDFLEFNNLANVSIFEFTLE